ncbi:hypothetical protein RIF29_17142 [Crotalaria pallida]|uniref:Uncharacterized protein n=1 Tax=Crotalaria pallida TaxID=3830 RepID=A0AAN9FGL0_CROPI
MKQRKQQQRQRLMGTPVVEPIIWICYAYKYGSGEECFEVNKNNQHLHLQLSYVLVSSSLPFSSIFPSLLSLSCSIT